MSGGSSNAAWEAGVLWGFAHESSNIEDFYYYYVTGVSAGAINTAAISAFEPSDFVKCTEYMSDINVKTRSEDIFKKVVRTHGCSCLDQTKYFGQLTCHSVHLEYNKEPMFVNGFKRNFTLSAVDVNTGEYVLFNNTNIDFHTEMA